MLEVVGVGLGRTGTHSLKVALEILLDGPCMHMIDLADRPDNVPLWLSALDGDPDWCAIFEGYKATVDWPAVSFWRQAVDAYPDALVLLSKRESADVWWESAQRTIFMSYYGVTPAPPVAAALDTLRTLYAMNGIDPTDEAVSKRAYETHLAAVRAAIPPDRLLEWTPGDGWEPLCAALDRRVPDLPFPHLNSTEEFRARFSAVG